MFSSSLFLHLLVLVLSHLHSLLFVLLSFLLSFRHPFLSFDHCGSSSEYLSSSFSLSGEWVNNFTGSPAFTGLGG